MLETEADETESRAATPLVEAAPPESTACSQTAFK
jgi:hypothetical protein